MSIFAVAAVLASASLSPENAADIYQPAFEHIEARSDHELDSIDWVEECLRHWYPISAADLAHYLREQSVITELFMLARDVEACDFGVDIDADGFNALLPHVSSMMNGVRMLESMAMAQLEVGHADTAAAYIDAAIQAGLHIRTDKLIINSLVSVSTLKITLRMLDDAQARGVLRPEDANRIATRLTAETSGDAFGVAAAIETEKYVCSGWLKRQLGLDNPAIDQDAMLNSLDTAAESDIVRQILLVPNQTVAYAQGEFAQLAAAYDIAIKTAKNPSRESGLQQLAKFEESVDAGQHGNLAQLLMPSVSKVLQQRNDAIDEINARAAELRAYAATADRGATINGGRLLIEASVLTMAIDELWINDPAIAAEIDLLLAQSLRAKEVTMPPIWEGRLDASVPWWLPAMIQLNDGLLARIDRDLHDQNGAMLAADAATLLRVIAAMANDPHIASSLVAAETLKQLTSRIVKIAAHPATTQQHKLILIQHARAIPVRDPAGLIRATSATQERLRAVLNSSNRITTPAPDDAGAVLCYIAWARGLMQVEYPGVRLVPSGLHAATALHGINTPTLAAWQDLGASGAPPENFTDSAAANTTRTAKSVHDSVATIRDALSE